MSTISIKNKDLHILFCIALIVIPMLGVAQISHPEGGFVFDDSELPRIDLAISPSNLASLYADPSANLEYKAQFRFTRGDSVVQITDVGLRFRGNTARDKQKKSFRISFNTFDNGRDFSGIEKMNLNAETNDPSLIRSMLSWKLFRSLGIPGSRSNHVLLYINNDFYGVYINTEHMDEKFVRSRFNTNDGNFYKCLYPSDLAYRGSSQDDYKFEQDGERVYELRINEEWDDYQDLADFIDVLEQNSGDQLQEALEEVFNVQQYLKVMAVDVITGNWDGYIGNKNNFYLYRDPVTGRFEYIPYDLDNTFGIDWLGEEWSNRPIYQWHREQRPLYEKIIQIEEYKAQYTAYIKLLSGVLTSPEFSQEISRWQNQISTWVGLDPYFPLDWGFTFSDFENSLTTGKGGHLVYGVLEYAGLRAASALLQCIETNAFPLISHARLEPSGERINLDWSIEDDNAGVSTSLFYRIDQGDWQTQPYLVPSGSDPVSGIPYYSDHIPVPAGTATVDVYFFALDQAGQESRYPKEFITIDYPLINGPLWINEFMASNSSARMDDMGDFDDWVEIYNQSADPVWLADYYLSDQMGVPGKYRFPEEFLAGESFFLVSLDGQPEQGPTHADFKLKKDGELIRLSQGPAKGFLLVDSITFGPQVTDVALGRSSDAGAEWIAFTLSTPGFTNLSTGVEEQLKGFEALTLYPNPATGEYIHFSRPVTGLIYNSLGQPMAEIKHALDADIGAFSPGMYIFRSEEGLSLQFIVGK